MPLTATIIEFYRQFPIASLLMVGLMLPFIALERVLPYGKPPAMREYGFNIGLAFFTGAIAGPLGILAAYASDALHDHLPWSVISFTFADIGVGIALLDRVLRIAAMIFVPLLMHDIWFYWSHRLEHKLPVLWQFHKIHHSDINMNASTFARDHFLQQSWRAFFSIFSLGLILDLDLEEAGQAALFSNLFLTSLSLLYHSATRIRIPWLDRILVTPQVHRIHHSVLGEHQDKNFADALPIFDILFGTYVRPARNDFPPTGLADGSAPPRSLWAAQLHPVTDAVKALRRRP